MSKNIPYNTPQDKKRKGPQEYLDLHVVLGQLTVARDYIQESVDHTLTEPFNRHYLKGMLDSAKCIIDQVALKVIEPDCVRRRDSKHTG